MADKSPIDNALATRLATNPENFGAFSGAQITAYVDNVPIGTLTSMMYHVHTEKVAQYTFGSPNPRRFVTGKRAIAGSLTFNMFDRSALLSIFAGTNTLGKPLLGYQSGSSQSSDFHGFVASTGVNSVPGLWNPYNSTSPALSNAITAGNPSNAALGLIGAEVQAAAQTAFSRELSYTDQLPPFDLTLAMVDNTGKAAYMVIGGIEIINEGGGYNIDDMTTQVAYTFVARYMRPLTPVSASGQPMPSGAVPTVATLVGQIGG